MAYKRNKTHEEFIDRWAKFVRENPRHVWHPQFKDFQDSLIIMANRFYTNLAKEKGMAYVRELRRKRIS